jgi:hypothetical protein
MNADTSNLAKVACAPTFMTTAVAEITVAINASGTKIVTTARAA